MKLAGKLLLTLLSVAGLLGIFWLSLPWLLVSFTTQQLEVRGFSNVEFGDVSIGLHSAELESLRLSSDSMDFAAGQIAVSYDLPRLMSANLASISVDTMEIVSKKPTSSSSSSPDVAWLAGLLSTPWYNYLPADQINVHQLTISDEESGKATHASLELSRAENALHATVDLGSGESRSHRLIATLSSEGKLNVHLQGDDPNAAIPLLLATESGSQPGNIFVRFKADLNGLARIFPLLADDMQGQLDGELSLVDEVNVQQHETIFSFKAQLQDAAISTYSAAHVEVDATGSMDVADNLVRLKFDKSSYGNAKEISLSGLTIEQSASSLPDELQITDKEITIQGNEDTGASFNNISNGEVSLPEASLSNLKFTINRASDADTPSMNGNFIFELSELRKNDVVITASPIDIKLQIADSADSPLKLDATTDTIVVDTTEAMVEFSQCNMQMWLPENRISADILCHLVYPEAPVNAHLDYKLNEETGVVTFNTGTAMPTDEQPLFTTALKNWDQPYDLVSGSIVANGKYSWKPDSESLTVNLWIEDGGGFYEEVLFSGMEYEAQLKLLPEIRTLKPSTLTVDIIDVGIPVTHTKASINLKPSRHGTLPVTITNNLQMKLLEGEVTGNYIKYDLNTDNNDFKLDVSGLDLAAVVAMQQVEGLQATGLMDGQMPVHIGKDGLTVLNGDLHVQPPGGRIQYTPEGGTHEMEQAAPGTNIVFEILEDLNYHTMDTGVNYTPNGSLTLSLAIKGKSPKLDKKRPVHFNLNLEQNVLQLLRSLRIAEDIDSILDKNVQDYFKSQN
ncbi:MAG TPA: hypothetical protein DDW55_15125 [Gammaproteobacteria bacterium]|nr:hypothetical protein [Gammaproteobacteria bacterium]